MKFVFRKLHVEKHQGGNTFTRKENKMVVHIGWEGLYVLQLHLIVKVVLVMDLLVSP